MNVKIPVYRAVWYHLGVFAFLEAENRMKLSFRIFIGKGLLMPLQIQFVLGLASITHRHDVYMPDKRPTVREWDM